MIRMTSITLITTARQSGSREQKHPRICMKPRRSPGHDDKEVQSVPRVPEVTSAAKDSQGDHLYHHLQSKENVDERVESLKAIKMREHLADKPVGRKHQMVNYQYFITNK